MKGRKNMQIPVEQSELAILVLHMNIMRKNTKKGFKAKYGLLNGSKMIKTYDSIKNKLLSVFEEEKEHNLVVLIPEEFEMLHEFINWYVKELHKSATEQKTDIETDEQYLIIKGIATKINNLATNKELVSNV